MILLFSSAVFAKRDSLSIDVKKRGKTTVILPRKINSETKTLILLHGYAFAGDTQDLYLGLKRELCI
jgi:hypothetical protein